MSRNTVTITDTTLSVEPHGLDKMWSYTSRLEFPLAHVRGATHDPGLRHEPKGWRGPGLQAGSKLSGTFHADGTAQFWNISGYENTLVVTLEDASFSYGSSTVLTGVTGRVPAGQALALVGPNGSGKTTTIRSLLGIYQPTGGKLLIDGRPYSVSGDVKLGYLPEERGLYKKESVIDTMVYFGQLKGLSRSEARSKSLAFLERVGLADKAKTRLDKLSGGQQQKVQLGITIINDPELIILDEPTKGFDPVNRRLLMEIIEEHQAKGATVVMITHQMDEVERLCDRILLLKDGVAHAYGTVAEVRTQFGGKSLDDIFIQVYSQPSKEDN